MTAKKRESRGPKRRRATPAIDKAFKAASRRTLERIRRDRVKLPEKLQILLEVMERDLFDPALDVTELKTRCGIRDNSVPIRFHAAVGRPPHAYLEDRRMETACRLLSGSSLKVWEIAELTGYSSLQVFSRAFLRWSGERPTQFRHREEKVPVSLGGESPAADLQGDGETKEMLLTLRHAVRGQADEAQVARVVDHLLEVYPDLAPRIIEAAGDTRPRNGSTAGADSGEDPEKAARALWARLSRMPPPQQRALIERQPPRTLHLVDLLLDESRKLDTTDPARAVALADLAVAAAESTIPNLGADHDAAALMARVWTRLGEALYEIDSASWTISSCPGGAASHAEVGYTMGS